MIRAVPRTTLAWLLPAAAIVLTCGILGLTEPTETRYAEIAREMVATGDWLTPRLNGITHLEKPPLAYWAIGGGMAALGPNEWGARLTGALAAGFLLWCVASIAGFRGDVGRDRSAVLGPLILASCPLFFVLSQRVAADTFLAAAVGGFWVAVLHPRTRTGGWPHVAMAIGFLAKGPVVLVHTVIPLLTAGLISRERSIPRALRSARGWALFVLVALPWYLLIAARTPGVFQYWVTSQLWDRYTTTIHQRPGPWYYFLVVAGAGALPWTFAALTGAWRAARARAAGDGNGRLAVACWLIVPVLFFSASGSKLPGYVLPEIAPMAILAAWALGRLDGAHLLSRAGGVLLLAIAAAIELAGPQALAQAVGAAHAGALPMPPAAHAAAAAFALAGTLLLALRPAAGAAVTFAAWLLVIAAAAPIEGPLGSPRPVAQLLERSRAPEDLVLEYHAFNAGLPFYLRQRIPMVGVTRNVAFDSEGAIRAALPSMDGLRRLAKEHARIWVYAPRGQGAALADSLDRRVEQTFTWRRHDLVLLVPMG